jgi:hypothetical protein
MWGQVYRAKPKEKKEKRKEDPNAAAEEEKFVNKKKWPRT